MHLPDTALPEDQLAVTPEPYEAYLAWQQGRSVGACAIGPYGACAVFNGWTTAAIQSAAD